MKLTRKDIIEFAAFAAIITVASVVKHIINDNDHKAASISQHNELKPASVPLVFIDGLGTLHTSPDCKGIKSFMTVDTILIKDFRKEYLKKICARCITENQLEELTEMR